MQAIATVTINPAIDKSASVSRVVPDRKLYCGPPRHEPGGGGINVSRAIGRLGGESIAIYPAGGTTGQMLQQLMLAEGLTQHATPIAGLTRENLTVFEESAGQQFRFGMPGPYLDQSDWQRCLDALAEVRPVPGFVVASGSLPQGVPDDFYGRVAQIAKKLGARTIVDTSGAPLQQALEEGVYLIKPNVREFQEMLGREAVDEREMEEAASTIVQRGQSQVVVISLGAAGALGVWKDGRQRVRSPAVPIRSRVGAGDSTVAGIVLGLARGQSLSEALRLGVAAGAAAVMTPGTELCRAEDVQRLYRQMVSPDA